MIITYDVTATLKLELPDDYDEERVEYAKSCVFVSAELLDHVREGIQISLEDLDLTEL